MLFTSWAFLLFLAVLVPLYYLVPKRVQWIVLLLANAVFVGFAGLTGAIYLTATIVTVYLATRAIDALFRKQKETIAAMKATHTKEERKKARLGFERKRRTVLIACLCVNVGILFVLKYGAAIGRLSASLLHTPAFGQELALTMGISFYTFSSIGYLLDVYRETVETQKNPFKLALFISFFPLLVQGPISRYDKLMKQFNELPGFSYERVCHGLQRMWWGFFKKCVIADRITPVTSMIFADVFSYAGVEMVLAVIGNVIAIYMDFSGCMDIVIGAAEAMGVTLDENFRQPFFSKSAAEFWRRWHITLGAWFKDYVYMPIAMNPRFMKLTGSARKKFGNRFAKVFSAAVPLMIVWILTGLWHGTGKDYLLWGVYWGILIVIETAFSKELKAIPQKLHMRTESFGYAFFQMLRTCIFFAIGRMITACGAGRSVFLIFRQIFSEPRFGKLFDGSLYTYGINEKNMHVLIIGIAVVWFVDILASKFDVREKLDAQPLLFRWVVYYLLVMSVIIFGIYGNAYDASAFVYGGF